ncbi:MAG: N-formylglutamate amidohydrolase [Ectothiorhodospiraceae bacterium]|nr:N-formylglutamate amidohydrolase [Ectothiorhodospiraceae bacterium]
MPADAPTRSPGPLLGASDPAAVEVVNADRPPTVVLVCEHAGRALPAALGTLGLDALDLADHIAWDIGAATVARSMARRLDAPLVLQAYSRLVIDCNRPLDAPDSIPPVSDGRVIPGNAELTAATRAARAREVFVPYQDAVAAQLDRPGCRAAFSIHSFTPVMAGVRRPWDAGLLFRDDTRTSSSLARVLRLHAPELHIGLNQPYTIDARTDWFVPCQAEPRGLAHSLIEIRNDHLRAEDGCERWARRLADAITSVMEEMERCN